MQFVEITTAGGPVHINPAQVVSVKPESGDRASIQTADGGSIVSTSDVAAVIAALEA